MLIRALLITSTTALPEHSLTSLICSDAIGSCLAPCFPSYALQSVLLTCFKNINQVPSFFCLPPSDGYLDTWSTIRRPHHGLKYPYDLWSAPCGLVSPFLFLSASLPATLDDLLFFHLATLISTSAALLGVFAPQIFMWLSLSFTQFSFKCYLLPWLLYQKWHLFPMVLSIL